MTRSTALVMAERVGMQVILLHGIHMLVSKQDAERLDAKGVAFAFIHRVKDRIVSIPSKAADES